MADREPSRTTNNVSPARALQPRANVQEKADNLIVDPLQDFDPLQEFSVASDFDPSASEALLSMELTAHNSASTASSDSEDPFAQLPEFATPVFSDPLETEQAASVDQLSTPSVAGRSSSNKGVNEQVNKLVNQEVNNEIAQDSARQSHAAIISGYAVQLKDWLVRRSVPGWAVSMLLHVALLMTLATVQLEPVSNAIGLLMEATATGDDLGGLEESFDISGRDLEPPAAAMAEESLSAPSDFAPQELALPQSTNLTAIAEAKFETGSMSNLVESILPSSALSASGSRLSSSLTGRSNGAVRGAMLEQFGGNAASEKSVTAALKWIAAHQESSGGWSFGHSRVCRGQCKEDGDLVQATNAATALALLPFLGAGQTHLEGSFQSTVHNGLKFLINRMKVSRGELPHGSWSDPDGSMYSHGLAAIVVCEAYAMTRDPDLLQPAQLALNYIVYAQDPRGGGWRYAPKQPGDTSVVGWQLMAMKSGIMGNLAVPPESFRLANNFLDSVGVNDGAYYGYTHATAEIEGRQSTTAVGLLCRMYLGWPKDHKGLQSGVSYLSKLGPSVDNLYYSYYATQVMRQYGGEEWQKWNTAMRDGLIKAQVTEGHAAGSWYSPKGQHNSRGGRLYCTAMSAMILEVYYRHMPLYTDKSSDDEFEF